MADRTKQVAENLKSALRRLPGPVSLLTSCEEDSTSPIGMIASAVIPVSMTPASMLISINKSAHMHAAFSKTGKFCISLLSTDQTNYVDLFMDKSRHEERFTSSDWQYHDGLAFLPGACANIFCDLDQAHEYGSHELFIGKVEHVICEGEQAGDPLGWLEGNYARFGPV